MGDNNMANTVKPLKRPAWTRVADMVLRAAHVAATGILLGGAIFQVPFDMLLKWQFPVVATGIALVMSEVYHRPRWLYQGRAVMVFIHAGLFYLVRFMPVLMTQLLVISLLFGMVGSHMPRRFRHWSITRWRPED